MLKAAKRAADVMSAITPDVTSKVLHSVADALVANADEILEAVNDEDATKSKIVARLSQLVKEGIVVKELVKLDEGKRMSYKLA